MGNLSWQNAAVLLLPLWVLAAGCGDDAVSMAQFATNWNAPQPAASFYPASPTHGFNSHEVVDWDADGDLDLFLGSAHGDSVGLFLHPNLPGGIQSTPASFMAGGIYAISTIDWDGDGRPEVAVGRTNPMKVELYDDDIFGNQYSLHTIPGGKTTQLAWVDHDGDNTPDLSVLRETDSASALASAVYLDLTTPQGTQPIGGIVSLPTSSDVPQFTVHSWVDLDGYGDHELVTCGRNLADTFSWLYVWEYDSVTETWLQLDQMHIGDGDCRALAWADYDDDGDFDLAVAMAGSKNLLLRNTSGLPPLELACFLGDDDGSNDLGWGDWDADGLPDLVLFHKDGEGAAVWGNGVLRSCQPGGVMGEPATVSFPALGTEAAALSLADIDGDARIEIVVVPTEPGFAAMIVNNEARPPLGAGPPASSGDDGQAVAMVWADFSDDATEELVVVTSNGRLLIYAASPTGLSLLATHELSGGISPSTLALADWNNDGTMDALIGTGAGTPDRLLQVDSNGNMQTVWQSEPSNTSDALWVDLDLDGDLDLLRVDEVRGLLLNESDLAQHDGTLSADPDDPDFPFLSEDIVLLSQQDLKHLAIRDDDADGDFDIALCGADYLAVFETTTTPLEPSSPAPLGVPLWFGEDVNSCSDLLWSDLNGDGVGELVLPSLGYPAEFWSPGSAGGPVGISGLNSVWETENSQPRGAVAAADIDSDGSLELAFSLGDSNSSAVEYYASVQGVPTGSFEVDLNGTGGPLSFGDVDGDGDLDLVFGVTGSGPSPAVYTVFNNANHPPALPQTPTTATLSAVSLGGGTSTSFRHLADDVELSVTLRDAESDPVFDYRLEYSIGETLWLSADLIDPPESLEANPIGAVTTLHWDAAGDVILDNSPVRDGIRLRFVIVRQVQATLGGVVSRGAVSSNPITLGVAGCFPFDADRDGYHCSLDCDDTEPTVYPDAPELCDGVDTGCRGHWVAGAESDDDGDGFSECDGDCDDTNDEVYLGALELCDGLDNDCNGLDDAGNRPGVAGQEDDGDGDGYSECQGDCDDEDPARSPSVYDIADDGVDQDCSGSDTISCFRDRDGDGYGGAEVVTAPSGDCSDIGATTTFDDCNDADPVTNPGATETCGNGDDRDCDGSEAEVDVDPDCWPQSCSGCAAAPGLPGAAPPRSLLLLFLGLGIWARRESQ